MSDLFTKEIHLRMLQTFLEHMESAASKKKSTKKTKKNMTTICQEHQNKFVKSIRIKVSHMYLVMIQSL